MNFKNQNTTEKPGKKIPKTCNFELVLELLKTYLLSQNSLEI